MITPIELFVGVTVLGTIFSYYQKKENKVKKEEKVIEKDVFPTIFGQYCICYTKGNIPNKFIYIPWESHTYQTETDYINEEKRIQQLAFDKKRNSFFRKKGITGFAIINMEDGTETYWCALKK